MGRIEDKLRSANATFTAGSLSDCLTAVRTYFEYSRPATLGQSSQIARGKYRTQRGVSIEQNSVEDETQHGSLLKALAVRELLALHGNIIAELRSRKVVRTGNSPLGDYAEHLFASAFGWTLTDNSSSGHDAELDNVRYQIKARRISRTNPSRQLGAIRRLPDKPFDFLAAVLFDEEYMVTKAILIPHALVMERARHVAHTNSWRLMLEDRWWTTPRTQDVTAELRSAQV